MEQYIYEGKLKYFYERVLFDQRPITADLFITDFCNLDCDYCRYEHSGDHMPFDLFVDIVKRLVEMGVRGFVISGGGEPLINPDIDRILEWLNKNKISYGINTNGTRIPGNINPRWIKFSVDYIEFRKYAGKKGGDLNEVLNNIKKTRGISPGSVIGVQIVVADEGEIRDFCNYFYEWDVDYISVRPIESVDYKYQGKIFGISRELDRIRDDPKIIISYKWEYIYPRFDGYKKCYGWWTILNIDHEGMVRYCCNQFDEVVGSVFESNIMHKLSRHKIDMDRCEIPCRKSGINDFIRDLKPIKHVEFC